MFLAFGVLAIVVAAVGLYGVIAHGVALRKHEIGVRMALGARRAVILRLIAVHGIRLALASVAFGSLPRRRCQDGTLVAHAAPAIPLFVPPRFP